MRSWISRRARDSAEAIRQGIKEYGNWPTIPQLYVDGEFVGGSDIMMEMYEAGELAELFSVGRSTVYRALQRAERGRENALQ